MDKNETLTIRLPASVKKKLIKQAKKTSQGNISHYLRELIERDSNVREK